ncbi:ankyrin repeat-containing domain protein [Aspergillus avenaceus]|uniref:Ankyrin repeat-containing domain protein n=1 Tax=Aspergillus avenaceus TaxID=36643 RepID=A0A5N6TMG2_ASPAV|nr:ankyrin repeat-containing domain protein [Aspergillus avenaceus]
MANAKMDSERRLCDDIILEITNYADPRTICRLAATCKQYGQLLHNTRRRLARKHALASIKVYEEARAAIKGSYFTQWAEVLPPEPLYDCITRGNIAGLEFLLEAGADPNSRSLKGHTMLYTAIGKSSPACARLLIKHGAEIWTDHWHRLCHVRSDSARTEFAMMIFGAGHMIPSVVDFKLLCHLVPAETVLQILRERGLEFFGREKNVLHTLSGSQTRGRESPLNDKPEILDLLLEKFPALLNDVSEWMMRTPLLHALCAGDFRYARILLKKGAVVGYADILNQTELWLAVSAGKQEIVRELLKRPLDKEYITLLPSYADISLVAYQQKLVIIEMLARDSRYQLDDYALSEILSLGKQVDFEDLNQEKSRAFSEY